MLSKVSCYQLKIKCYNCKILYINFMLENQTPHHKKSPNHQGRQGEREEGTKELEKQSGNNEQNGKDSP